MTFGRLPGWSLENPNIQDLAGSVDPLRFELLDALLNSTPEKTNVAIWIDAGGNEIATFNFDPDFNEWIPQCLVSWHRVTLASLAGRINIEAGSSPTFDNDPATGGMLMVEGDRFWIEMFNPLDTADIRFASIDSDGMLTHDALGGANQTVFGNCGFLGYDLIGGRSILSAGPRTNVSTWNQALRYGPFAAPSISFSPAPGATGTDFFSGVKLNLGSISTAMGTGWHGHSEKEDPQSVQSSTLDQSNLDIIAPGKLRGIWFECLTLSGVSKNPTAKYHESWISIAGRS